MKKKILSLCCCFLGLGTITLFAQRGNVTAGGNASGTGGTVSYSIGQIFYSSPSGTSHKIVQGMQQPYEISVVNAIEETKESAIVLSASVFPNPAIENLTLKIENSNLKKLSFELYSAQGKLLLSKQIDTDQTQIEVAQLASADYILKVYEGTKEIKTFKITKYY